MDNRRWPLRIVAMAALAVAAVIATEPVSSQGNRNGQGVRIARLNGREVAEGEVLVRYRASVGAGQRRLAQFQAAADDAEPLGRRGAQRMRSGRRTTREMLAALRNNPDVLYAEPNYIVRIASTLPNDPQFASLWGLFNIGQVIDFFPGVPGADINAPLAWDVTTGSRDYVVGVVDTGIDYNHPDLAANMWTAPRAFTVTIGSMQISCGAGTHGFNAVTNSCNPMDDHSHGTHVAGTIGAVGNNGVGVTGVNWVASMMALKFITARTRERSATRSRRLTLRSRPRPSSATRPTCAFSRTAGGWKRPRRRCAIRSRRRTRPICSSSRQPATAPRTTMCYR